VQPVHPVLEESGDKYSKFFFALYQLVLKTERDKDFMNIYQNLKPYLKFLKCLLENKGSNKK